MAKNKHHHAPQKGLTYVEKQQIRRAREASFHRRFAIQYCMDAVAVGLNEHLGLEGQDLADCMQTIGHWVMELARITVEDAKDDKEIAYTKDQLDRRLQSILPPEYFSPWEERMTKALEDTE